MFRLLIAMRCIRVLLLTDGPANVGIEDHNTLCARLRGKKNFFEKTRANKCGAFRQKSYNMASAFVKIELGRRVALLNDQLTLRGILDGPEWLAMVKSYERYSCVDKFEAYFERPWSIHGVRHARRVLFHTLVLCELCRVSDPDKELLVSAALFHDIGRDNDGLCFKHGKLSAEKMVDMALAPKALEDCTMLKFIVTYHCINDSKAEAELQRMPAVPRERIRRLFSVLKDADGLDRVRIGDLDVSYLRNPQSMRLTGLAHELLVHV